ncbi:MAG TPA: hypothetical protein VFH39_04935 [Candidatus Saccharimonadales bacterium]|nr:hypothetical protein [Candidatus Saccharimonadales bacterium]
MATNKLDDLGENARQTTDDYIDKQKEKVQEQKEASKENAPLDESDD